jgi:hypothetical protein
LHRMTYTARASTYQFSRGPLQQLTKRSQM